MIEMYERSPRAISRQAVGDFVTTCLPSRLSRVRIPSPALLSISSLCKPVRSRPKTSGQRLVKQGDNVFMCKNVCSDILPRFRVTSCLTARDILPHFRVTSCPGPRDILPTRRRDILPLAPNNARLPPGAKEALKGGHYP